MSNSRNGHISITGVSKYFGRHKALDDVSLEIEPGTVTVILGPSGSGKSTLLRAINHLERVDEGFIQIDGDYIGYRRKGDKLYELKEKEILRQRVNVGYVFQNFNLFPHLTVLENLIEAPIAHKQATRKEAIARAYDLLDVVGLRNKADAWSRHLSGGQQYNNQAHCFIVELTLRCFNNNILVLIEKFLIIIEVDIVKHTIVRYFTSTSMTKEPSQAITKIFLIICVHKDCPHVRLIPAFKGFIKISRIVFRLYNRFI